MPGGPSVDDRRNEGLESRMTGNGPVRFGGRPTEKVPVGNLAGGRSYWRPVWHVLEGACELLLVNARHVKAVPGRKTDVGRQRVAGRPAPARAAAAQLRPAAAPAGAARPDPHADEAGRRALGGRAAPAGGAGGRQPQGGRRGHRRHGRLGAGHPGGPARRGRATRPPWRSWPRAGCGASGRSWRRALAGRVTAHHRLLLALHLEHVDFLDEQIDRLSEEIARTPPARSQASLDRLDAIPGVGPRTAEVLAAEVGLDMGRFPSAAHLASWAGMCPGSYESAGKQKGGKTRKGNKWLRRALVEAACAAARNKATYLAARYRRLLVRSGKRRAAVAVGHTLLCLVYALLADGEVYHEPGPAYLDDRQRRRVEQRALDQLRALGYEVTLTPRRQEAA